MLRPILIAAAVAATTAVSAPAQAQVQLEFGIDRPGYDGPRYHEPRGYPFAGERRGFRGPTVIDDDDDDCRIVIKRRVNRYGELVERRMRICD
ncbi:hypothetical protein [Bosea sp. BIWAKO-01]|uniref:hypothetical protein n=1 Tax=Bosea sp. BIWAKO-01 TaxID=506668 RepID=UPI00114CB087|nr:hypothetical protein [Bosea sp. BIWAKO-01]